MVIQGIQNRVDLRGGVPVDKGFLYLWSNAIGVVSSQSKARRIEAYKLGYWLWIERSHDPSTFERLNAHVANCDGNTTYNCWSAIPLPSYSTAVVDLNAIPGDGWHYMEFTIPSRFAQAEEVTFASIAFYLTTFGTGTNVYIDDVDLEVCGKEVDRFGGGGSTTRQELRTPVKSGVMSVWGGMP